MKTAPVLFRRVRPGGKNALPAYQSALAAGMDISADIESPMEIQPLERAAIPTGFAVEIAPGFEIQVRPRSGLAAKTGLTVLNAPGTIDADYRGEVKVLVVNLSNVATTIAPGDRIAQLVLAEVSRADVKEVAELTETARGAGGFGSTGR